MAEMRKAKLLYLLTADSSSSSPSSSSSSSSESETDEDLDSSSENECSIQLAIAEKRRKMTRINMFAETTVLNFNSGEFKSHFRLLPETFEYVLGMIGPKLINFSKGRKQINPKKQLLISLWMMATPDSYRSVCQKFNIGQATALRSVRRVSKALYSLAPKFIVWPTGERAKKVANDFEKNSAFPGIIGAIDGTHIQINAPKDDAKSFMNRKNTYSIQVQAVCTSNLLFTSMYAGNVGSVHDARVFRLSPVAQYISKPNVYFENSSHLVGDGAYGIHPHIMVPYRDNGHLTQRQRNFNFCLSSARMSIERCFGVWKGRWRSILHCLPMVTITKIPEYLLALAVLHNICILKNDMYNINNTMLNENDLGDTLNLIDGKTEGVRKREIITNQLILRHI